MKMINFYIKSFKLANHLILTIPSRPPLSAFLQPTVKPFDQTCFANQLLSFYAGTKIAESTKDRTEKLGRNGLR